MRVAGLYKYSVCKMRTGRASRADENNESTAENTATTARKLYE